MSYDRYGKTSRKERFGSAFIVTRSAEKTNGIGGFVNARLSLFGQSHEIPEPLRGQVRHLRNSRRLDPTYADFALWLRGGEQLATKWGTVAG
jgi:hypothetical protein